MLNLPSPDEIRALPPDGGPEFNRLIFSASPYLLQHARNPVDWHPWGEEALDRARAEDKPVFLSVGYAACHWCHVMEHESFENPDVAEVLNRHFVPIKVDREARPDLDEIYMLPTQMTTGHGGWPNSVWLTPDGRPWFAGTYFPPEDRPGRIGFKTLLLRLAELWRTQRPKVEAQADHLAGLIRDALAGDPAVGADAPWPDARELLGQTVRGLGSRFDSTHGGFNDAPKFPPHQALELLLRPEAVQTLDDSVQALDMAVQTLDAMLRGGVHDQVGGGFHRYATDRAWFLPHFEKMLYDQAQLARAYALGFEHAGREAFRRVALRTCDFVLRGLTSPEGGFLASLDADSEAGEGAYYQWTTAELGEALGPATGEAMARLFGATDEGNAWDEATRRPTGANILHLRRSWPEALAEAGLTEAEADAALARLLEVRAARPAPGLDDKVIAAWNGLMISALVAAARIAEAPRYLETARRAATFVRTHLWRDGRLARVWRGGRTDADGTLDDYAAMALGLLDLHAADGDPEHLAWAVELAEAMEAGFAAPGRGGYTRAAKDRSDLLASSRDVYDNAEPSGNGLAARMLVRLASATGEARWAEAARRCIVSFRPAVERAPSAAGSMILAALEFEATGLPTAAPDAGPDIRLEVEASAAAGESEWTCVLVLHLPEGWHAASQDPGPSWAQAARLRVDGGELTKVEWPDPVETDAAGEPLRVLGPGARIRVAIRRPDATIPCRCYLDIQPCDATRCLAPRSLTAKLP